MYTLSGDVSRGDIRDKLLEGVAKTGHVDVLINCAGMAHTATLLDTPPEKYEVKYGRVCRIELGLSRIYQTLVVRSLGEGERRFLQSP